PHQRRGLTQPSSAPGSGVGAWLRRRLTPQADGAQARRWAAAKAYWRKSARATTVIVDAAKRVTFGASTRPNIPAVATHWPTQNGQVSSSPRASAAPSPRTSSLTSEGAPGPSNRVTGARNGLVTGSFEIDRAVLCVAIPSRTRSRIGTRFGSRRPEVAMATAPAATAAE